MINWVYDNSRKYIYHLRQMKLFLDPAEPGCCVILHLWDAGAWRPQQELQCDLLCVQLRRPCKFPGFRQRKMKWRTWFCPPEKLTGPTFSKQQSRKDWAKPLEICWKMTILWAREKKKTSHTNSHQYWCESFLFCFSKKGQNIDQSFWWKFRTIQLEWFVFITEF